MCTRYMRRINWTILKKEMEDEGFTDEQIEEFKLLHYNRDPVGGKSKRGKTKQRKSKKKSMRKSKRKSKGRYKHSKSRKKK